LEDCKELEKYNWLQTALYQSLELSMLSVVGPSRPSESSILATLVLLFVLLDVSCCRPCGQHYSDIHTPTPLRRGDVLIIGFMGGRDSWRNEHVGVGRLAAGLRKSKLNRVHVETVENLKRSLALRFVKNSLDRDGNGELDDSERSSARIILYGQSFGGAAVVKFARQLDEIAVPVLLTVQIDSVGRGDEMIPPNVKTAANFYQDNGRLIRGANNIRAMDPNRTIILFNRRIDYRNRAVQVPKLPWYKKAFRTDHVKMDNDPEVWHEVERLILHAIEQK
jgi:hypothetical protein